MKARKSHAVGQLMRDSRLSAPVPVSLRTGAVVTDLLYVVSLTLGIP